MFTDKRLTQAYKKAKVLPFDDKSKFIFFSDVHRGITGVEILEGHILLVDWRIRADKDGVFLIERNIIRGPEPISMFNQKNFSYRNHRYIKKPIPEDNC